MRLDDLSPKARRILHQVHDRGGEIDSKSSLKKLLDCSNWFLDEGLKELKGFGVVHEEIIRVEYSKLGRVKIMVNDKGKKWVEKDREAKSILKELF